MRTVVETDALSTRSRHTEQLLPSSRGTGGNANGNSECGATGVGAATEAEMGANTGEPGPRRTLEPPGLMSDEAGEGDDEAMEAAVARSPRPPTFAGDARPLLTRESAAPTVPNACAVAEEEDDEEADSLRARVNDGG